MAAKGRRYLSFLLRLWQVRQNGLDVWRASLEDPHNGRRYGFADLKGLFTFLSQQMQIEQEDEPENLDQNAD